MLYSYHVVKGLRMLIRTPNSITGGGLVVSRGSVSHRLHIIARTGYLLPYIPNVKGISENDLVWTASCTTLSSVLEVIDSKHGF